MEVEVGVAVVGGGPEGFAVGRGGGAGEFLFLALVDDGDAVLEDGEGEGVFDLGLGGG